MAQMSSTGGWKNNAYTLRSTNACTKTKSLLGKAYESMAKALNTTVCPTPPVMMYLYFMLKLQLRFEYCMCYG